MMAAIFRTGYGVGVFFLLMLWQPLLASSALAQDSLCAEVKIEIKQKLSLERQAFDAHMRITNGLDTSAIENVGAILHFEDDKGNTVVATSDPNNTSAHFFARVDTLSGIDSIDGGGKVNPKATADIHWLIIPAQGTGGTEPGGKLYFIGATLTYTLAGQASSVDVTPDFVTVKPQPLLDLDYFLAGDVYADDPFTPETEPPIPFTLGVRINNVGGGPANKVTIESAQPKIVENRQGLLIDFKILDSYVSDQPAGKTLLIDFGDILPHTSKVGRWNMVTTLSGKFVDINASYTHADSLGGALTSLIRNINSYLLVHDVKVDLPGRDNIRDFLAKSSDVLRVYESDGGDHPVADQSRNATLQSGSGAYQITFPSATGFAYARMTDPFAGKRSPIGLVRSDGKILPPENIWLSQTRDADNNWQYFVNIFDVNTTGRYSLNFASGTTADIEGVVYHDANSNGQLDDGESGLGNVKVTLHGSDNEGAGVSTTAYTTAEGQYKFVSLKPGTYKLKVDAIDGYINGARTVGSVGGALPEGEDDLIAEIVLPAGANASGYRFAKRKPSPAVEEADLAIAMIANKTLVQAGDEVIFTLTASNAGPAGAIGVTVTGRLPQGLELVTANASIGAYDSASGVWTIGSFNKGAVATLTLAAKVGGIGDSVTNRATITSGLLDPNSGNNTAQVTLTEEGSRYALTQYLPKEARVLVLVSCPAETGEDDIVCAEAKAFWMTAYLGRQGYKAQAVHDTEAFRMQLRSGKYNVFWINGGAGKLAAPLAGEIRLAVLRGDTLIVDGVRDAQSGGLDSVTGTALGTPLTNGVAAMINGSAVTIAGDAMALMLHGAVALANFNDGAGSVAMARHAYGQGMALSAAFDLIGTLQIPVAEQAMHAFLVEALSDATPAVPETVVGNAYVPIAVDVIHNGKDAATGSVFITLPTGVTFVEASPAPSAVLGDRVIWTLPLVPESRQALRLGVRVPADNVALRFIAGVADTTPAVTASLDVAVKHFDAATITGIIAQATVPEAAVALGTAQAAFGDADYESTIAELVKADEALGTAATVTQRHSLSQWLQEAELLWQKNTSAPAVPASIVAVSGTPQAAAINTVFSLPLRAKVLDADANPVAGAIVTFSLPASGAGATFAGSVMTLMTTTDAQGFATTSLMTANGTVGSYSAVATVGGGVQPASFALANTAMSTIPASITATDGTPQNATVNTMFLQVLQATVLDASSQPVPDVDVTFTLPVGGASATFAGGGATAVIKTNAQGIATSPRLTANGTAGTYQARAAVPGVADAASFVLNNTAAVQIPASIVATHGTPQSAMVNTTFTQALRATVFDDSNQPVPGVSVTFTVPVVGASATFAGNSSATITTDAQGVAMAPPLDANGTIGEYEVTASVVGIAGKAIFVLSNTSAGSEGDAAARIDAIAGMQQAASVGAAFARTLQAKVFDADDRPLAGIEVTFALPDNGASAVFANGQQAMAVRTNAQGIASSAVIVANAVAGDYVATASVSGVVQTANFALANYAGMSGENSETPERIVVIGGTPQITAVNAAFAEAMQVVVLDSVNRPVKDIEVTFELPSIGASAQFANAANSAVVRTDVYGKASSPMLIANTLPGNYSATAAVGGMTAGFDLTNCEIAVVPTHVVAIGGARQAAAVSTAFENVLQALVIDENYRPVPGVAVTFSLPGNGASASFAEGATATVTTNMHGIAASPALVANAQTGDYQAEARVVGIAQGAVFPLTNAITPISGGVTPASIIAAGGTPQAVIAGTAFAQILQAKVLDANFRPVPNVKVTFTLPVSGASAAFLDGTAIAAVWTDTSGVAISPTLIANEIVGDYHAMATAENIAQAASFSLANKATPDDTTPTAIAAIGGASQSAMVNAVFGEPLSVRVTNKNNQPLSDVAVTFFLPRRGAAAQFAGNTAAVVVQTDALGVAVSPSLTANATAGDYVAEASVAGVPTTAVFALTNTGVLAPVVGSIEVGGGSSQSAVVNAAFGAPLKALVKDTNGTPMAGVEVVFALPASGASANFAAAGTSAAAITGSDGISTSPALTANGIAGAYQARATVSGVGTPAVFELVNTAVAQVPASIIATSGTPQSATVNTVFTQALQVTVRDAADRPVPGVTVTFATPVSGSSATFGSAGSAIAITNAQGVAKAPTLTANNISGSYQVRASVVGIPGEAIFALTNIALQEQTSSTFSGTTATGTGTVTATVSGGGADCKFDLRKTGVSSPSGAMMQLLGKYLLPHGVFGFELVGCTPGSTVTITTTWPNLKGITGYMKYGPTPPLFSWLPSITTWYVPNNLRISGNTVTYTVTDGKLGDDDLIPNGVIRDPGGPVLYASAEPIPALNDFGRLVLFLLAALAGVSGYRRIRRGSES